MTANDIAAIMQHRITEHAEEEARAQHKQAECHEAAMKLTPHTPERNTLDGGVAYNLNRKAKARAAYMALIDVARCTHILTEEQIQHAMKQGHHNAGNSQWTVGN